MFTDLQTYLPRDWVGIYFRSISLHPVQSTLASFLLLWGWVNHRLKKKIIDNALVKVLYYLLDQRIMIMDWASPLRR